MLLIYSQCVIFSRKIFLFLKIPLFFLTYTKHYDTLIKVKVGFCVQNIVYAGFFFGRYRGWQVEERRFWISLNTRLRQMK